MLISNLFIQEKVETAHVPSNLPSNDESNPRVFDSIPANPEPFLPNPVHPDMAVSVDCVSPSGSHLVTSSRDTMSLSVSSPSQVILEVHV